MTQGQEVAKQQGFPTGASQCVVLGIRGRTWQCSLHICVNSQPHLVCDRVTQTALLTWYWCPHRLEPSACAESWSSGGREHLPKVFCLQTSENKPTGKHLNQMKMTKWICDVKAVKLGPSSNSITMTNKCRPTTMVELGLTSSQWRKCVSKKEACHTQTQQCCSKKRLECSRERLWGKTRQWLSFENTRSRDGTLTHFWWVHQMTQDSTAGTSNPKPCKRKWGHADSKRGGGGGGVGVQHYSSASSCTVI